MAENKNYLTEAQNEARENIIHILSEHFTHYVLIVETELDMPNDANDLSTFWCGAHQGHSAAVGLMTKYQSRILDRSTRRNINRGDVWPLNKN